MRDYVKGYYDRELYPGALRDFALADDAGHPDPPAPTEQEMARAYFAQLDPSTVSADEYAEAMLEAREPAPKKGFGFPEQEEDV